MEGEGPDRCKQKVVRDKPFSPHETAGVGLIAGATRTSAAEADWNDHRCH